MRWFLAIIGGFSLMLAMNSVLFYLAFNGGDTVVPSYDQVTTR